MLGRGLPLYRLAIVVTLISAAAVGRGRALTLIDLTQDSNANYSLGLVNTMLGHYDRAIGNFDAVIKIDPRDDRAYSMRCWVRAIVGTELDRALTDCDQVLRLNPNNVRVLDHRGFTYLKRGEYHRSIADYDQLLGYMPMIASALYGRGVAKQKSGDVAGGTADISAAKALQGDIAEEFARHGVR